MATDKDLKVKVINALRKKNPKLTYNEAEDHFNKMTIQEKEGWNKIAGGAGRRAPAKKTTY